jgi:hypothetical protein
VAQELSTAPDVAGRIYPACAPPPNKKIVPLRDGLCRIEKSSSDTKNP